MARSALSPAGISLDNSEVNRRTMESQLRRGLDENSPRFGDRPYAPRSHRNAAYLSSASDSDDGNGSMQIKLRPSPAKTVSPTTPFSGHASKTHPSPVSMFDGMAKELRREFEKVTGAHKTPKPPLQNKHLSAIKEPATQRRPFTEISNQPTAYSPKQTPYAKPFYRAPSPAPSAHLDAFDSPAPATRRSTKVQYQLPDVTGLTEGLASPERGMTCKTLPTPRRTVDIEKQQNKQLETALHELESRLNQLEDDNEHSMRRVQEIETGLDDGRRPNLYRSRDVDSGIGTGSSRHLSLEPLPPRRVDTDNDELPGLVERLHAHVARLSKSLSDHSHAVTDLQNQQRHAPPPLASPRASQSWQDQIDGLRAAIEALTREVQEVKRIVEGLAESHKPVQPAYDHALPARAQEPAHTRPLSYYLDRPASAPLPYTRTHPARQENTEPLPRLTRASDPARPHSYYPKTDLDPELRRAEAILRSMPRSQDGCTCRICQNDLPAWRETGNESLPPQTRLSRALCELEEDFATHKAIYVELSEAYRKLDPASNMHKRHALAAHLKESIEALESKADEIKRLYDLLHYRDHPETAPFARR